MEEEIKDEFEQHNDQNPMKEQPAKKKRANVIKVD